MRPILFPALLVWLAAPSWAADTGLDRLFTTQAERAQLDLARQRGGEMAQQQTHSEETPVTLYGYVVRNDGATTAWLDQLSPPAPGQHLIVTQAPGRAPVVSVRTENGKRLQLKVGDTVDLKSGQVQSVLGTDGATVTRGANK